MPEAEFELKTRESNGEEREREREWRENDSQTFKIEQRIGDEDEIDKVFAISGIFNTIGIQ